MAALSPASTEELDQIAPERLVVQLTQQRHESRAHQIELELQNEGLTQANLDLEAAR